MTPFSPDGYRSLLAAIAAGGYRVAGFDDDEPAAGTVLLRHDVDLSLEDAVAMAEIEHDAGVAATYLLMTRSAFYNLASPAGLAACARLRALGHRVGHHALHPHAEPTIDPGLDRVLAWHNPDPAYMAEPVPGWVNVMEERFTAGFERTYRSDSNQTWRRGDPVAEIADGAFPWLQLLIHPVLWMGGVEGMPAVVERFLDRDRAARLALLHEDDLGL